MSDERRRDVARRAWGVVESHQNGSQDHYTWSHFVDANGDGPPKCTDEDRIIQPDERIERWSPCQWPARTNWRDGVCSRMAPHFGYGLAICWQHQDESFDHVVTNLERNRYYRGQVERLAEALISTPFKNSMGTSFSVIQSLLKNQVAEYLRARIDVDGVRETQGWIDDEIDELVDELLAQRMQQKWGSLA